MRRWLGIAVTCAGLQLALGTGGAGAALITDSSTFAGFSVTYDDAVWGPILFPHEADSFSGTLPVDQFGFGRFFFDPEFSASSDGSAGPPELRVTGQIVITAKPGWGLYDATFIQSGQWQTQGDATVSVAGSLVDVAAPGAVFFFTDQRAFTNPLAIGENGANGYYYIFGERATLTPQGALTLDYDVRLAAFTEDSGFAHIANDPSDPSFLGRPGPYPESNVVGTFISAAYQRVAPVPEPATAALSIVALAALAIARRARATAARP